MTEPQPTPRFSQAGVMSVQDATPGPATVHPVRPPVRLIDPAAIDVEALARVQDEHYFTGVRDARWECSCGFDLGTDAGDVQGAHSRHQAQAVKAHLTGGAR